MATTNLNISVIDKRMLKLSEAATYAGLALKHFKSICPVSPVQLTPSVQRWDRRDLDKWIDDVKSGDASHTRESILDRLE